MLQYNKHLHIATAGSRHSKQWVTSAWLWSDFAKRCAFPIRSSETINEYLSMPKSQQDDLKDCNGGFVGGALIGNRRKRDCVTGRDILALDLDAVLSGGTADVLCRLDGLGCSFLVYSTRKHRPDAPRLRVLFPVAETAAPDEYEPALRKIAEVAGVLPWCDPSTFEVLERS